MSRPSLPGLARRTSKSKLKGNSMPPSERAAAESGDPSRLDDGRTPEHEGEERTNLIRITGIAACYIVELINHHGLRLGAFAMPRVSDRPFHLATTALAVSWTMVGLWVSLCLRGRAFPS